MKSALSTLLLAALLLGAVVPAAAAWQAPPLSPANMMGESIDFAALDAYIAAQMEKHNLQGVSLAVARGQEIIYSKGYGTAGEGRPMTPQTPMYIGSQSKSVTALAIMQLAAEGKVDVMEPVQTYLPWFRVADPAASKQITVRHLLQHTSGLSEAGFYKKLSEQASIEGAVRALAWAEPTEPVGAKFQYFNYGYDILSLIVQSVSGQPFPEYLQQHIFDPLEMNHTYTDPAPAQAAGLSQGYSRFFGFTIPRRQPHRVYELGAGYIISTAEDMARYAMAMLNDGQGVLPQGFVQRMFLPVNGYGYGWFVQGDHIYHGGANETFKTYVDLYPRREMSIVLLINQGYLFDHYISGEQLHAGVEKIVLGGSPPAVSPGWSVQTLGWALLGLVSALVLLHGWNFYQLKGWAGKASGWSRQKLVWDVAVSFLIPTIILVVIYTQTKNFFGYRFNLTYQVVTMFTSLPDIAILSIVGTVPDFVQGLIKLGWLLGGKVKKKPGLEMKPGLASE